MLTDDEKTDYQRELDKIDEALSWCETHIARSSEANAALHVSTRVMYSPLHSKVVSARETLLLLRSKIDG